jgi:FkbM family methyltransferase
MMKNLLKLILQKILGFENYLFIFSIFKIYTLKLDKREGVFLALLNFIKDDDIILDIGANIGIMTVLLAQKCPKGKVYAFEPIDENYKALIKVLRFFKLKNVQPYKLALGEKNEIVKMILPTLHSIKLQGLSHVVKDNNSPEVGKKYLVEQVTLDSFWKNKEEKISAIKIDVENYENVVFKGASDTIEKSKPIIYAELWENENRDKSIYLLTKLGYDVKVFNKDKFEMFDPNCHKTENFFFFQH